MSKVYEFYKIEKGYAENVAEQMCDNYCKYPVTHDFEMDNWLLEDTETCKNCPLTKLLALKTEKEEMDELPFS